MTAVPAAAAEGKLDAAVFKVAGVVVLGAIMSILDITVVSVALPTFQTVFNTSYANVAWTMTGYTLALATVIPLSGWAADRYGPKRMYMTALVLFVLGSALGFVITGLLAHPQGELGRAIAVCGVASLAAAILLVPRLPESHALRLDDLSPTDARPPEEYGRPA